MVVSDTWSYKDINYFYDRVRMLLNNVSNVSLTDDMIDYYEKAPSAELYVKRKVPNWQELDETKFKMFESAIVYLTASYNQNYAMSKVAKKRQLPTMTIEYTADQINMTPNGTSSLKEIADSLINEINGIPDDTLMTVIGFRVTP